MQVLEAKAVLHGRLSIAEIGGTRRSVSKETERNLLGSAAQPQSQGPHLSLRHPAYQASFWQPVPKDVLLRTPLGWSEEPDRSQARPIVLAYMAFLAPTASASPGDLELLTLSGQVLSPYLQHRTRHSLYCPSAYKFPPTPECITGAEVIAPTCPGVQ